jgi:SOS-response transcriptional repressor LexA
MPIRGRRNRRFAVKDGTVEYRKHSALPFMGGSLKVSPLIDLAVGGLQFVSDALLDNGQRLDLKAIIPGAFRALTLRGEVVWSKRVVDRDAYRTGVRFIQPEAADTTLLRSLEERFWSMTDEEKEELSTQLAEAYPIHLDRAPDSLPPPPKPVEPPMPEFRPAAERPPEEPEPEPEPPLELSDDAAADAQPAPEPEAEPEPEAPAEPVDVPVYDLITAIQEDDDGEAKVQGVSSATVRLPDMTDPSAFAMAVHDVTMHQPGSPSFDRGDIVVFSPNVAAHSGDLAFVVTGEGGMFRQVFLDANDVVRLRPLNGWYPEQQYSRDEVQGLWKLIGRYESFT